LGPRDRDIIPQLNATFYESVLFLFMISISAIGGGSQVACFSLDEEPISAGRRNKATV